MWHCCMHQEARRWRKRQRRWDGRVRTRRRARCLEGPARGAAWRGEDMASRKIDETARPEMNES